ncbi:MAG: hypothetical protein WC779_02670 [Candidatus Omnitrophota bacterium]|jgi:hypothetical protein
MAEKIRKLAIVLAAIFLVFWVGFKSGVASGRITNKLKMEAIKIPYLEEMYFLVDITGEGASRNVTYRIVPESDIVMMLFRNPKLRELLKMRDMQIYTYAGDRIY